MGLQNLYCRHEIICFRFFSWIIFLQAPENNTRVISNVSENSRRYSQVKMHHRWVSTTPVANNGHNIRLLTTSSDLEGKIYLHICHRCLELRISLRIFEKFRSGPNCIIRGLGETDPCRKPDVENLVALSLKNKTHVGFVIYKRNQNRPRATWSIVLCPMLPRRTSVSQIFIEKYSLLITFWYCEALRLFVMNAFCIHD